MNLIRTSFFTAISSIIKVIVGFVINKVIAVYIGPSGLGLIGQLQSFMSIATTLSNGAITQGIIKYTAEYKTIEEKQKIFSTSIIISLFFSFLVSVLLFSFSDHLAQLILKNIKYSNVFNVLGITVFLFALNGILLSILNGQKEIKKYVFINIASSLFSLVFTSFLIIQLNLMGALYALVANQSVIFFVTLLFVIKSNWFKLKYFTQGVDKKSLIKLSRFSFMAVVSVIAVHISHMLIRNYIGENLSWDDAGYWQGIWYISSIYLMLITTSLNVYYLPRLSEIDNNIELKKEILYGYKVIMPIVIVLALGIFFFRQLIMDIAFTNEFRPMLELFKWQLIGDVIKIGAWLLSMVMLAKAMTKVFVITEIIFSISFVGLSILFLNAFGLVGITYAFSVNYFIYLIVMFFIFRRNFV